VDIQQSAFPNVSAPGNVRNGSGADVGINPGASELSNARPQILPRSRQSLGTPGRMSGLIQGPQPHGSGPRRRLTPC